MSRSLSPDDEPRRSRSVSYAPSRSRSRSASPMDRSASRGPSDRGRARQRSRSPPREPISLYISGLAAKVIDEDLYDHFRREGQIKEARVVLDPRTRDSRGFGFVDYEDPRDAERAIKHLDKTTLKGRIIIVEKVRSVKADCFPFCGRNASTKLDVDSLHPAWASLSEKLHLLHFHIFRISTTSSTTSVSHPTQLLASQPCA